MPATINIVEPTLQNEAGHCYSFINALCEAGGTNLALHLWADRHAKLRFAGDNIRIEKFFLRKLRRLQSYFLYKRLLATPDKLFVSTAGRTDLMMVSWASNGIVPPEKAYFYFHWFNANDKKLASLKRIARRQPNFVILGPTPSVTGVFQEAGFANVHIAPYPISRHDVSPPPLEPVEFRHVLYAGAARKDKGFSHVVDLIAYLHEHGAQIPVVLQTSPEHYGKYDAATRSDIQRLQSIPYSPLKLSPETLSAGEYSSLFAGAVCLQLYDRADFSDRVSGVTLDAFSAGSPIVATEGTWIARMAQRFNAGITVDDCSPPRVLSAIQKLIDEYPRYNRNAHAAGLALQQENDAGKLFQVLAG